jgi:hypothetical protein
MKTTPQLPAVRVDDPGDLIAALPHLLAFHPVDSLIAVVLGEDDPKKVAVTLRVDLPAPRHRRALAHQLLLPISQHAGSVVLVVIGGGTADPPGALPHQCLVDCLDEVLEGEGIEVRSAVWASATAKDAKWFCYDEPDRSGTVPDPTGSELAAVCAASGMVTFASREELAKVLAPDDDEALARRNALLNDATEASERDFGTEESAHQGVILVERAVAEAPTRATPLSDEEVVALALALSDLWVRDTSLAFTLGPQAMAAERLWAELTRATPAPERAQPATLLAFSAYLRGDGALAAVALEAAELACPSHRLASLVRRALDHAMPPEQLEQMALAATRTGWRPDGPQWP